MHSLQLILGGIRTGNFLTSIDLTEAYLHIPILASHQQFLRFCYTGCHFQYRALPFGLQPHKSSLRFWQTSGVDLCASNATLMTY